MEGEIRRDSKGNMLREREGERSDGVYYFRYKKDGKRIYLYSKSLATLREKEIMQTSLLSKIDICGRGDISKYGSIMTLNDLADIYMAYKKNLVELTTFNTMCTNYNSYVRNNLGDMKIIELKSYNIKNLYLLLYLGESELSLNTLSRINNVLSPMLQIAYEENVIPMNPAAKALSDIRKIEKKNIKKQRALTELEQKAFVEYCRRMKKHSNIRNLIFLLLGTGCRIGEALALTWDDVDFAKKVIHINRTMAYARKADGHYGQYIKKTKTSSGTRDIPLLEDVINALAKEKDDQFLKESGEVELDGYKNFVFISPRGKLYSRENISIQIKQIISEYNAEINDIKLPVFTTNTLRHTFATRLCSRSGDIKSVQYIMGHKDISTTLRYYADPTYEGVKKSIASLEGVMF